MLFDGPPGEAAARYRRSLDVDPNKVTSGGFDAEPLEPLDTFDPGSDPVVHITGTAVDPPPDGREFFRPGDRITFRLRYRATGAVECMRARIMIKANDGVLMLNSSTYDINEIDLWHIEGEGEVRFTIEDLPLMDHRYHVSFVLQDSKETFEFDHALGAVSFDVESGRPISGRVVFDLSAELHQVGS